MSTRSALSRLAAALTGALAAFTAIGIGHVAAAHPAVAHALHRALL